MAKVGMKSERVRIPARRLSESIPGFIDDSCFFRAMGMSRG